MLRTLAGSSAAILSSRWLNVQVLGFELQLCHCLPCDLGHGTSVCVPVSPSVTWFIRGLKTLKRVRYSAWVKGWKKLGYYYYYYFKQSQTSSMEYRVFDLLWLLELRDLVWVWTSVAMGWPCASITLSPLMGPLSSSSQQLWALRDTQHVWPRRSWDQGPSWPHPTPVDRHQRLAMRSVLGELCLHCGRLGAKRGDTLGLRMLWEWGLPWQSCG